MCYECWGKCPKGVPVPDALRSLAYHDFAGDFHHAAMSFREVTGGIGNVRCSDCSQCAIECPNGVHVQERLIRAQELLG
jgi:predicted aldo/keto reductase-like oxidoreductase